MAETGFPFSGREGFVGIWFPDLFIISYHFPGKFWYINFIN
jgi:hypothetical protein